MKSEIISFGDKDFFEEFKLNFEKLISDVKYLLLLLSFNFLAYGFLIKNRVIHVDDLDHARFYTDMGMIKMGRFTTWFIDYVLGVFHFNNFFLSALGIVTMIVSAILLAAFIKTIVNKITTIQLAFVSIIFSVFPMLFFMQIFLLATFSISIGYCLVVIITVCTLRYLNTMKMLYFVLSVVLMIIIVSLYETFVFVYLQLFAFLVLMTLSKLSELKINDLKKMIIVVGAISLLGVIGEFIFSNLLIYFLNLEKFSYIESKFAWFDGGSILTKIRALFSGILIKYYLVGGALKSALGFILMSIIYFILALRLMQKNHSFKIFFTAFICYALIFSISFLTSTVQIERMSQGLVFFMALSFSLMFVYFNDQTNNRVFKSGIIATAFVICLWSSQEISEAHDWLYNRFKIQENLVNQVILDKDIMNLPKKVYLGGKIVVPKSADKGAFNINYNSRIGRLIYKFDKKFGLNRYEKKNNMIAVYHTQYYLDIEYSPMFREDYQIKLFNHYNAGYKECKMNRNVLAKQVLKLPIYPKKGYISTYKGCTIVRIGK